MSDLRKSFGELEAVRGVSFEVAAGEDKAAVTADVRTQAERAYDLLERGYAGLGAPSD